MTTNSSAILSDDGAYRFVLTRSPDPQQLIRNLPEPRAIQGHNLNQIDLAAFYQRPEIVICAWGTKGDLMFRNREVTCRLLELGVRLNALRLSKDSQPMHPLYLPKGLVPVHWNGNAY